MRSNKVDSLMVVDRNRTLLGVVQSKDVRQRENNYGYVKDIMHPPLLSTSPDSDIISVLKALQNATTSNMPVVDADGKLEGLITKSSLVSTMSTQFLDTDGEGALHI